MKAKYGNVEVIHHIFVKLLTSRNCHIQRVIGVENVMVDEQCVSRGRIKLNSGERIPTMRQRRESIE